MKEYIIKANVSGKLADECLNVLNASELVRCKDCKYGKPLLNTFDENTIKYAHLIECNKIPKPVLQGSLEGPVDFGAGDALSFFPVSQLFLEACRLPALDGPSARVVEGRHGPAWRRRAQHTDVVWQNILPVLGVKVRTTGCRNHKAQICPP